MRSGGLILWNAIAICEMTRTSWQTGNLKMNEDLGNLVKDQLFHLVRWWNTSQFPRETKLEFINSERNCETLKISCDGKTPQKGDSVNHSNIQ